MSRQRWARLASEAFADNMKRHLDSGDDPVPQRAAAIFTSMAIYIAVLLLVLVVASVLR